MSSFIVAFSSALCPHSLNTPQFLLGRRRESGEFPLLSESSTSLSGDISDSDFMFLETLRGWEGRGGNKTKTLYYLLNSFELFNLCVMNKSKSTSLDTVSYHRSQDETCVVTRRDKAAKNQKENSDSLPP